MKKLIALCAIVLTVLIVLASVAGCRQSTPEVVSREAVVMVKAQYRDGSMDQHSGFIISPDGYIFTFLSERDGLERVQAVLHDGRSFDASRAAIDTLNDAARIKIEATGLSPLVLPEQDVELGEGDTVVAAGYIDGKFTTKTAKIVELNSVLPSPWTEVPAIKLDTGAEPGMMGGPVVDAAGRLVGAVLAIDPETGESFMVPRQDIISMFFPTPEKVNPSLPPSTSNTQQVSREQAIETATRGLSPSIVARGDMRAELHGWYWEVTFDNLNAKAEELMPFPLRSPPPGGSASEAYPGIYQSVVLTVDAETGDPLSAGASKEPKPGPYVSREQAISSARERITSGISETWLERAMVEAYLRGDIWIVLFWEEGASIEDRSSGLSVNRFRVSVDAVTGEAEGLRRG